MHIWKVHKSCKAIIRHNERQIQVRKIKPKQNNEEKPRRRKKKHIILCIYLLINGYCVLFHLVKLRFYKWSAAKQNWIPCSSSAQKKKIVYISNENCMWICNFYDVLPFTLNGRQADCWVCAPIAGARMCLWAMNEKRGIWALIYDTSTHDRCLCSYVWTFFLHSPGFYRFCRQINHHFTQTHSQTLFQID